MQTRGSRRKAHEAATEAARQAVIASPDLLPIILRTHACEVGGWNAALLQTGLTCKAFHAAVMQTRSSLERWGEIDWQAHGWMGSSSDGEVIAIPWHVSMHSPDFTCGGGAYSWRVRLVRNGDAVGLFLSLAPHVTAWRCNAEFELTLHAQGLRGGNRTHHFLHYFYDRAESSPASAQLGASADRGPWGHHTVATVEELCELAPLSRSLRVTARVRVLNGPRCLRKANGRLSLRHSLVLKQPRDAYGMHFPGVAELPFYCDCCATPSDCMVPEHRALLWHCAACSFDICLACWPEDAPRGPAPGDESKFEEA